MQQQTWRMAGVLLMSLAAPMALSAQTPSKGASMVMIVTDPTKSDSMKKDADTVKAATPTRGQTVRITDGNGHVLEGQMTFGIGNMTVQAKKDSTKADSSKAASDSAATPPKK